MYCLFWGVPTLLLFLAKFSSEQKTISTYVTFSVGLITGLNSAASIFIYMYKHEEMRRSAIKLLGQ